MVQHLPPSACFPMAWSALEVSSPTSSMVGNKGSPDVYTRGDALHCLQRL